jgi:hypothetical protein
MSPEIAWPTATLGPLARARSLAASIPSAAIAESTLDAPFGETWAWLADLPQSVPEFDRDVSAIRIQSTVDLGDGVQRLRASVSNHGVRWPFTVRLEPGFCLMQARARVYVVIMAAAPETGDPSRTRFVHVEGVPLPGVGFLAPVLGRLVTADLANMARLARRGFRA